jgi:Secretory lipase
MLGGFVGSRLRAATRHWRDLLAGLLLAALCIFLVLASISPSGAVIRPSASSANSSAAPGTLIASKRVSVDGVAGAAAVYLVDYYSETVRGAPVKVTGVIFVPSGSAPAGGWPVVSWAHATVGTNKNCAPSLDPFTAVPNIDALLAKHWEVVATDYQGEANSNILSPSPGTLPYLVGVSAARNTIDIVRAARHLSAAHASNHYVVWGWSEGGQTAMFVLEIAKAYSSGLDLEGVLAMAPPSNFGTEIPYTEVTGEDWPLLFLAVGGLHAGYGNTLAPTSSILTAKGEADLGLLGTKCLNGVALTLVKQGFSTVFKFSQGGSLAALPATWRTLINRNDPANSTNLASTDSTVPLVVAGGSVDTVVDPATTTDLANELCALHTPQDLERWVYAGLGHDVDVPAAVNDFLAWTADRFSGDSSPGFYHPAGTPADPSSVTNTCG